MPKNIILKNLKKSFTRKIFKSEKLRKWQKKGRFLGTGGPHFDPFFTIFCKSLLNIPTNIILKNQKIFQVQTTAKMAKKGGEMVVFLALEGQILTLFHNSLQITSKYAKKYHIKNQ